MLPTTALLAPIQEGVQKRGQESAKAPAETPNDQRNRGAEANGFADMVAQGQPTAHPDPAQAAADLPKDAKPDIASAANGTPAETNAGRDGSQAAAVAGIPAPARSGVRGVGQPLGEPALASAATSSAAGLTATAASPAGFAPTPDQQLARTTAGEATGLKSPELLAHENSATARNPSERSLNSSAASGAAPGTASAVNKEAAPATASAGAKDGTTAQDSLSSKGVSGAKGEAAIESRETIARSNDSSAGARDTQVRLSESPASVAQASAGALRNADGAPEDTASAEQRATAPADGSANGTDGTGNAREAKADHKTALPAESQAALSRGIDGADAARPEPPNGVDTALSGTEPRTETGTLRTDAARDIPRPAILREALPQIVETVRANGQGTVELTLNPEELGRIRMSMSAGEAGLQVTIQSDRADTTELLRRHIALLRDELASLGYTQVDIGFGGRHSQPQTSPVPELPAEPSGSAPMAASSSDEVPSDRRAAFPARLDMRL